MSRDANRHRTAAKASSSSTTVPGNATTATTTAAEPISYTVKPGDSLSGIAHRFRVSADAILKANQLTNPDRLAEGQTLLIPPAVPVTLVVAPATVPPGGDAAITLTGALPAEKVTFRITTPSGAFTGPPHVATPDGKVTANYAPGAGDPTGTYTIVASGGLGTTAQATFVVGG